MDDSGTKLPDKVIDITHHSHDWFAFGGVIIHDEDIDATNAKIEEFRLCWPEMGVHPLHSTEIRGSHQNFAWLIKGSEKKNKFLNDLGELLVSLPLIGIACVIDRPGYNSRYKEQYGQARWKLCKTAFAVSVERAAKYARSNNRKLRVYVERSSKAEDAILKSYYDELKVNGDWFDKDNSSKYTPLSAIDYAAILYDFKTKNKSSRLMQIADIFLWPICIGGYDHKNIAYEKLKKAGKLIDCLLDEADIAVHGIKYSCFEIVRAKNAKAE